DFHERGHDPHTLDLGHPTPHHATRSAHLATRHQASPTAPLNPPGATSSIGHRWHRSRRGDPTQRSRSPRREGSYLPFPPFLLRLTWPGALRLVLARLPEDFFLPLALCLDFFLVPLDLLAVG